MAEDTMFVRSATPETAADGGTPTAFGERDLAHPDGEVYVHGDNVVEVAKTAAVMGALKDGRIVEVSKKEAAKAEADAAEATAEQEESAKKAQAAEKASGTR